MWKNLLTRSDVGKTIARYVSDTDSDSEKCRPYRRQLEIGNACNVLHAENGYQLWS